MTTDKTVALVTGASTGIGRAIAQTLARAGLRVFGTSRRGLEPADGVAGAGLAVTTAPSVAACVDRVMEQTGRIDLLINNAGIAMVGALEESTAEQARTLFETNLFGVMRVTRAVLPAMRARRSGRVVNIGSVSGFLPGPFTGVYAMSKHALRSYSESLDHELRTMGIRVSVIEPAFTRSSIGQNMMQPDAPLDAYARGRTSVQTVFEQALAHAPEASTVADVVLKAATAARPKLRYQVGRQAAMLAGMQRALPAALFERAVRSQLKLDS